MEESLNAEGLQSKLSILNELIFDTKDFAYKVHTTLSGMDGEDGSKQQSSNGLLPRLDEMIEEMEKTRNTLNAITKLI